MYTIGMQDAASIVRWMREKYEAVGPSLDELGRRRWAAAEARSLGYGGVTLVHRATRIAVGTIRRGLAELGSGATLPAGRQRRPGGGRKKLVDGDAQLLPALIALVEPVTRGDPTGPLRWTCKSTRTLAATLQRQHHVVAPSSVRRLLKQEGYSLQGNRKTLEGKGHPDRDAQFRHINARVKQVQRLGQPALSVDTKKKEVLGNVKNSGREWRRQKSPRQVTTHDFPDKQKGKAVPYGIYDIQHNEAFVSVGISADTAEFSVAALRRWYQKLGRRRYPQLTRLLITADRGGSNGSRNRLWKWELQRLADELQAIIEVCHFPPGTSKWNKVEHRLFCHITSNWRGQPLTDHQVVVSLIGSTKTSTGLVVHARLDRQQYAKGRKITDAQMAILNLKPHRFHGEWNYEIHPRRNRPE
jgi:transposase